MCDTRRKTWRRTVCRLLLAGACFGGMMAGAQGRADTGQQNDPAVSGTGQPITDSTPGQKNAANDVDIRDGWAQHVGRTDQRLAIYFTAENTSETAHLIDSTSSPVCGQMFGYHSDLEVDSLTRDLFMHLTIPPRQILVFPPGGYHLVCALAQGRTVKEGDDVPVAFHFLGGSGKTVHFQVRGAKPVRGLD